MYLIGWEGQNEVHIMEAKVKVQAKQATMLDI